MKKILYGVKKYKKQLLAGICLLSVFGLATVHTRVKAVQAPIDPSPIEQPTINTPVEVEKKSEYYSFLFLGSDKGAQNTNGGNHTDSVTFVAYSPEKKKVVTMPIYRDALLPLTCGGEKNINHVYRDHGADCLIKSVEKLLTIPVNYYIYTTADAFVSVADSLGGVPITARESLCSPYSNDGKTYCVEAGREYTMSGNMLLAYARDRNHGSGVPRANRHQDILQSMVKRCTGDFASCAKVTTVEMSKGNIAHNIPVTTLIELQKSPIFPNEGFTMMPLDAIKGANFADAAGSWHMKLDEADIAAKKATILSELGEPKKENV